MAAKLKKRLSKIENKLLKLDKLELKDLICSICHSILIEPVTLPCYHDFCQHCFNGSIENNALCCPLCRLRIGSWIRAATKQKNLVNVELWNFIKSKFSKEIKIKTKGEDLSFLEEKPPIRLSAPGEIRLEYEAELKRLRFERLQLEQKQFQETEFLIKKIQQEEEEAHKKYLDALKQDEILAQQIQGANLEQKAPKNLPRKQNLRGTINKKVKAAKIDSYLAKLQAPVIIRNSPLLTDDNTSTDSSTPKVPSVKQNNRDSPEIVSSYGKLLKNLIDKKIRNRTGIWNKENGDTLKDKHSVFFKEDGIDDKNIKSKNGIQSLLVSLPLPHPGVLQHKTNASKNRSTETDSFDSTQQELCYFKPIEGTTPISKRLPLRVPGMHVGHKGSSLQHEVAPSRAQYIEGLCRLRNLSMAENLPSAFVIALNIFRVKKDTVKCETNIQLRDKKVIPSGPCLVSTFPAKRSSNRNKQIIQIDGITELNTKTNLRRTRSMGCISKDENETTPKKAKLKDRKVSSEKKLCLRSNSKKSTTKKDSNSSPLIPDSVNNNKVNLAIKNLSSPLKNCDFKNILQEQLRIEKIIEQEKNDFELARKVEAEWNGRRQPRRLAVKRQLTLNYALRPSKKLKV
ncbi:E3 ubiquitin-protein ligase rnf168-like [Galleria mellonella]|uniref:RING-type E3 ubiquitin transferase n=1 Tax=Galleria mellonella TaxID=7137 RepID=A0ABM3MQN8_GALME|nr:E3 ubiquitin-protein ligase rnf168-like [Galleria mellonella]